VTGPTALYESAASCYERAGYPARAAACLDAAGSSGQAARLFEQAGDLLAAARCHRRAGQTADAERCYLALQQPEEAAACAEEAHELLRAAFILAASSSRVAHARWLATEALARRRPSETAVQLTAHQLQARAVIALCDARTAGDTEPLASALRDIEESLPSLPHSQRLSCETFAVTLADTAGRHDLAARVLAASHRAGTPGASGRWHSWAARVLRGTTGLPEPAGLAAGGGQ
jgi:hypothetical protein